MRHEKLWKTACALLAALWLLSLKVALWHLSPYPDPPWWLLLFREPVISGVVAAATVGVLLWRWAAPASTAFRVGRELGRLEGAPADVDARVIPMPRRSMS